MTHLRCWWAIVTGRPAVTFIREGDRWFAFDAVVPVWGEGTSSADALDDLRPQLVHLGGQLARHRRLGRGYREQLRYLKAVA